MDLSTLPEDVLQYILQFCDVSSVLRFGQTTKYFHRLTSTPAVWISLVKDLRRIDSRLAISSYFQPRLWWPCFVEIVSLDLETGISDLILMKECPAGWWANPWGGSKICGDIATIRMNHAVHLRMYLVIDWCAQAFCKIVPAPVSNIGLFPSIPSEVDQKSMLQLDLVPGHLAVTETLPSGRVQELSVYAVAALSKYWAPLQMDEPMDTNIVPFSIIPKVLIDTMDVTSGLIDLRLPMLAAFPDPLEHGAHRVWLYIPYHSKKNARRALLCVYRLILPTVTSVGRSHITWRRRERITAPLNYDFEFTYSGHMHVALGIVTPGVLDAVVEIDLANRGDHVHVTPYSGALTYATSREVLVSFPTSSRPGLPLRN
ncbi:hypothetical protein B0H11DRAFT_2219520 [Mycena galericulata]|nr:hypothetical protein B0H11DRAFT_2219520 [Mycena galericulata]